MPETWTATQDRAVEYNRHTRTYTIKHRYVVNGSTVAWVAGATPSDTTFPEIIPQEHSWKDIDGEQGTAMFNAYYSGQSNVQLNKQYNWVQVDIIYSCRVLGFHDIIPSQGSVPLIRYNSLKSETIGGKANCYRGIGTDGRGIATIGISDNIGLVAVVPTFVYDDDGIVVGTPWETANKFISAMAGVVNEYQWCAPWQITPKYYARGYWLCLGAISKVTDRATRTTEFTIGFTRDMSRRYYGTGSPPISLAAFPQHLYYERRADTATEKVDGKSNMIPVKVGDAVEYQIYPIAGEQINGGEFEQLYGDYINNCYYFNFTQKMLVM